MEFLFYPGLPAPGSGLHPRAAGGRSEGGRGGLFDSTGSTTRFKGAFPGNLGPGGGVGGGHRFFRAEKRTVPHRGPFCTRKGGGTGGTSAFFRPGSLWRHVVPPSFERGWTEGVFRGTGIYGGGRGTGYVFLGKKGFLSWTGVERRGARGGGGGAGNGVGRETPGGGGREKKDGGGGGGGRRPAWGPRVAPILRRFLLRGARQKTLGAVFLLEIFGRKKGRGRPPPGVFFFFVRPGGTPLGTVFEVGMGRGERRPKRAPGGGAIRDPKNRGPGGRERRPPGAIPRIFRGAVWGRARKFAKGWARWGGRAPGPAGGGNLLRKTGGEGLPRGPPPKNKTPWGLEGGRQPIFGPGGGEAGLFGGAR